LINQLPADLFHAKPFVFKRLDDGFLLYTTGLNGQDDAGSNEQMSIFKGRPLDHLPADEAERLREQIGMGADDFSIRLPRLPLNPPSQQASPVAAP
jgi:hypothetical protein